MLKWEKHLVYSSNQNIVVDKSAGPVVYLTQKSYSNH